MPGRQHISLLFSILILLFGPSQMEGPQRAAAAGEPPATLTLRAAASTRYLLSIEPGFTLFLVFDAPIEFVAIGDEQLLSVAVRAPGGVVGLKATQRTGRTNVHIQAGGVLTVFEARISHARRSADVVHVVTTGSGQNSSARSPTPPSLPPSWPPVPPPSAPVRMPGPESPHSDTPEATVGLPSKPAATRSSFLSPAVLFQVQEVTASGIHGAFQAYRTAGGIEIRYELRNASGLPWKVATRRVLMRADGKIIGARAEPRSADGAASILAAGATESGLLRLRQHAATVDLLFPLFSPIPEANQPPLLLTVRFTELETLVEVRP